MLCARRRARAGVELAVASVSLHAEARAVATTEAVGAGTAPRIQWRRAPGFADGTGARDRRVAHRPRGDGGRRGGVVRRADRCGAGRRPRGVSVLLWRCRHLYRARRHRDARGIDLAPGARGASEPFARCLAQATATKHSASWGVSETGAAGPSGNAYGDPAGHTWVAVRDPTGAIDAQHLLSEDSTRVLNMERFAAHALNVLVTTIRAR